MKGTRNHKLSSILGKGILVMLMAMLFMLPSWVVTKVVYGSDIPKEFHDMVEVFDGNNKLSVYNPIYSSTAIAIGAMDPSCTDLLGIALEDSYRKVSTIKVRPGIYRLIRGGRDGFPYYLAVYKDITIEEGYDYYVALDIDPFSDSDSWKIKRVKR